MTEADAKPRRQLWKYVLALMLGGGLALAGLGWYSTTDSFQAMVRGRLVATLERITGGRVELGSIHTVPFHFQIEVRNLTIHGREQEGELPYAHLQSLMAQIKLLSLLRSDLGLKYVVFDHPVIHIIVYPDGTTNQPEPRVNRASSKPPVEQLFALSIDRLEVRHGELLWGDQRVPLDLILNDVSADMSYSMLRRRYDGNVLLGKVDSAFKGLRPVAWNAEAHFTLAPNQVQIHSLRVSTGRSEARAKGLVQDFRQPRIEADYDANLDVAEAAAVARRPEFRRGMVRLTGHASWSGTNLSSIGKLQIANLDWRDAPVGVHHASLSAQYRLQPDRLLLSQIEGRVLSGLISGDAEISNWRNPGSKIAPAKAKESERQSGMIHLRFRDLSTYEIASALASAGRPFERLKLAGLASGTVDARWKGSVRDTEARVETDVAPPARVSSSQLPLTAHARGTYRAGPGELQIDELTANTRATQVHASGTLSSTASLRLSVSTTDLGEWQPVIVAAGYTGPVPVTLRGHASFSGSATGRLSQIAISGTLQSQDFETLIPATSRTPAKMVTWNSLRADIQVSPSLFAVHNGILVRNPDSVRFDLQAHLSQRHFTDKSQFQVRLDTQNADLASFLALAGYGYPVSGVTDFQLRIEGTPADPHGEGHIMVRHALVYGEPIEHFSADLAFTGAEIHLKNLQLTHYEATVAGDAAYGFDSGAYSFQATGANFDLTRISALQNSRVTIQGRADFTASGSGTLEQPVLNAEVHLRDLTFDQERAGDFTLHAVSQGEILSMSGESQFDQADLKLDGQVRMREDWPADVHLRFRQLDVDSLLRVSMRAGVTGHSRASGEVHVFGPLRRPRELQVVASLDPLDLIVEEIKLRNSGPVRFSISNQTLRLEQFHLVGDDTDITASGTARLDGQRELDLRAQGQVNLKLIETFNPDFTSSGVVSVDLTVAGVLARPAVQGRVRIDHGSVAYIDLPSALSDINGALVFNQDRLQIETLTAHTGGGLVTFSGYATAYNGNFNFDLGVRGQGVRLRYPPGVSASADADLRFAGSSRASSLTGDIVVNKLSMTPGFDFGAYLERSQASVLPPTNRLLNRIRLDVHVATTPELQMQTAAMRISGDADLRLRGTAAKPVILGRADIIEGEVTFNGTRYRLERGDVTFINPVTTTPVLDLQASTRVRDYDVTLNLNGQIDRPNVTYRSEPPLPTSDIIALLAFGQTAGESAQLTQSQSAFSQETSSAILSAALNATVSNRVQRLFGVSRIKIDPQGLTTETSPTQTGPAVTIEQQVQNNLTLTYTTNVAQASQQIIQVEYNVTRNISVVGVRDQNGVVSFDVRVRQRKK